MGRSIIPAYPRKSKRMAIALAMAVPLMFAPAVVTATAAHAHTSDIKATTACVNGTYEVTFTLTLAKVPEGATSTVEARTGTTSFQNNWTKSTWNDWTPKAVNIPSTETIVTWKTLLPGTTTGNGPWEYAVTSWSDGVTPVKSDTRAEGLTGACHKVVTPTLEFTPGTCDTPGTVTATDTDEYSWASSGPESARIYTASPKGNVELTKTVFGPYDLRQIPPTNPECPPIVIEPDPGATITGGCLEKGGSFLAAELSNNYTAGENTIGTPVSLDIVVDLLDVGPILVQPNEVLPLQYTFKEDTGKHTLEIYYEDELLASKTIKSDCITPAPPTPEKPKPAATVLASTGSGLETASGVALAASSLLLLGLASVIIARRRKGAQH